LQLAIIERNERLIALQDRWDSLREAKAALAREDFESAIMTGVVCRRLQWVGGKDGHEVEEYEINTALIESLNSVDKRAAIETGQEQENVNLTGQISAKSIALSKVMTRPELEELERKMLAAMEEEQELGQSYRAAEALNRRVGNAFVFSARKINDFSAQHYNDSYGPKRGFDTKHCLGPKG
jgi:hypothetical protein